MVRVGPKVFSDPFAEATTAEAQGVEWPKALQALPGAVDGWDFSPSELGRFLTQRTPEMARLVLTNAATKLSTIAKRLDRRGFDKSAITALRQASKEIDLALSPTNLGHASESEAVMIQSALRTLSDALAPYASKNEHAEALAEQLHLALATPSKDEAAEEVVLDSEGTGLFVSLPESEHAPLRVLHEGPIAEDGIAALVALARARPIQLADLDTEGVIHLWRGPKGEVRCDDVAMVAARPDALKLATVGSANDLDALLDAAATHGLAEVHLHLDAAASEDSFGAALQALESIAARDPNLTVTIRDADDQSVVTAKSTAQGWSLRLPQIPKALAAEVDGVMSRMVDAANVAELSFDGVGFARDAAGEVVPSLPRNVELRQVFRTVAPIFADQLGRALGFREGQQGHALLRPFFRHAIEHLNFTQDEDARAMRDAASWVSALKDLATYASSPQRKAKLVSVFNDVVQKSESPSNDGFGNGMFRGHARGRNAFDLVRGISTAPSDEAIDRFLSRTESLFGLPARGAVVGIARDAVLSDDRIRRGSAKTEEDRLRALAAFAGAVDDKHTDMMVAVLPTDRTHGNARTPTPDFYVRRRGPQGEAQVFVDAKARAAIGILERDDTGVKEAVHQVFGHRFGMESEAQAEGMVMLDVYGGSVADQATLLAKIQRDVDAEAGGRPLWVDVQFRPSDGPARSVMLAPSDLEQPTLPAALRPGALV